MATSKAYNLIKLYETIAFKSACKLHYTDEEKDMSLYRYIMAGKKYHEFMVGNVPGISRATLLRHMDKHTTDIKDGKNVWFNLKPSLTSYFFRGDRRGGSEALPDRERLSADGDACGGWDEGYPACPVRRANKHFDWTSSSA